MLESAATSRALSALGNPKAKLILLGPTGPLQADLITEARSFSIEHVSPAALVPPEISRRTPRGSPAADQSTLAAFRKWFWARKPDAGFLLEGFPATLLQAKVLDEWLEARGETLTAALVPMPLSPALAADAVVAHYRTQGLLTGAVRAVPQDPSLAKV